MKNYQQSKNKFMHNPPIYLLPNLFTLAAMFSGFYAVIASSKHDFISCGYAILFAMIFDSLDGRVARLTHTSSPFGAELDSLSDMVSFGVAPAIIGFNAGLSDFGKFGWVVSFIYCACAGLRLAKFNTTSQTADKRFFSGMPSPAAAIIVVGYFYLLEYFEITDPIFNYIAVVVIVVAALSMVSNVKFYSFKEFVFHQTAPFKALVLSLAVLSLLILYPSLVIYSFFICYMIVSFIMHIFKLGYNKKLNTINIAE